MELSPAYYKCILLSILLKNAGPSSVSAPNGCDGGINNINTAPEMAEGSGGIIEVPENLNGTNTDTSNISLEEAMTSLETIRTKALKAAHHHTFLRDCLESEKIPKGLRIQNKEVHLMNTPSAADTRKKLAELHALTERGICKALIEHYANVKSECEEAGIETDRTIREELKHKGPEATRRYEAFLEKLENSEDNMRSTLSERRRKKLFHLTPHTHPSRAHSHTRTPFAHTPQVRTPARKTLGPVRNPGDKRPNTPYRKPDRTPARSGSRPALLSPPPTRDMELKEIRSTLTSLVSIVNREISNRACPRTSDLGGQREPLDGIPNALNTLCFYRCGLPHVQGSVSEPFKGQNVEDMCGVDVTGYSVTEGTPVNVSTCSQAYASHMGGQCEPLDGIPNALNTPCFYRCGLPCTQGSVSELSKGQNVEDVCGVDVTGYTVTESTPVNVSTCSQACAPHVPALAPPPDSLPHKSPNKNKRNASGIPQDGLLNLSKHVLSTAEALLLRKGLSFVPTPLKVTSPKFDETLTELCDRYKNRFSLPNRSERLIDCSFEAIRYDLSKAEILQPEPNLTKAERLALRDLKKNKDIVITKADKGDTTVIMDTSHLIELAHKHLNDTNTYQLLKSDPTPEIVTRFNRYIQDCLIRGVITQREHDRLHLPEDTSTQTMYFLPKIHKCPLKLRPIVSCTDGPTCKASAFLDELLQPHMRRTKSYLKNSTQLVNILRKKKISAKALLVCLDIESLYTNISHDQAITAFIRVFKNHPQLILLVDLLKFVLKNNVFEFDNLTFTQTCGLAMGTKLAPALATIYIGQLEETFLAGRALKPDLWFRYIDDIFGVWSHTLSEFHTFLTDLNGLQDRIKFTAEVSQQACNFLDLTIYKPPSFKTTGLLSTRIYYKPTNTFSFPLNTSYIPAHIHKGIAIGEMTRVIRNTTSPIVCRKYRKKLMKHLIRRGYSKQILKRIWRMRHASREDMLKPKIKSLLNERPTPFCVQFTKCRPSIQELLKKRWKIMHNDFRLMVLFPNSPTPVFTSRPKLKSILSKKRCKYNATPSEPNLTMDKAKDFEFLRFNHPRPLHRIP